MFIYLINVQCVCVFFDNFYNVLYMDWVSVYSTSIQLNCKIAVTFLFSTRF